MPLINILKICKQFIAKNNHFSQGFQFEPEASLPIRNEYFPNSITKISVQFIKIEKYT